MTNREMKNFEKAKKIASVSSVHKFHVGAVAVHKHHVISVGCNSEKMHPVQMKYNVYREAH